MTIPWPVLLAGLLIIAMSIQLIKKRSPKNDLYGFRTPKTMAGSEAEWLVANQRAGWALCAAGIVTVIGCLFFRSSSVASPDCPDGLDQRAYCGDHGSSYLFHRAFLDRQALHLLET